MSDYLVLARKKRPQNFKKVLGQQAVVQTLQNALGKDALAHAYLFSGPRGVGKTTLARILAKAINCQNLQDLEPCNECSVCKEITSSSSLDIIEIDGASNRGIDEIRKINETAPYMPSHAKAKIYIIDEVHMLTKEAFNALLKMLEEPPSHVKFFFATTDPKKIPLTIISRCQHFVLKPLKLDLITNYLQELAKEEGIEAEMSGLASIAKAAQGSMRDALSLFDQVKSYGQQMKREVVEQALGIFSKEHFFKLDEAIQNGNDTYAFILADQMTKQGKQPKLLLEDLMTHFRNYYLILTLNKQAREHLLESEEEIEIYFQKASSFSKLQLQFYLEYLIDAIARIDHCSCEQVFIEVILCQLISVQQNPEKKPNYESIIRFAAVELEGSIKKPQVRSE